ncbi:MAG: DUF1697 domain-containing protein [Acidobacteria bacterium]|nr:DUF1697 domain-containing protein [Acidobacteriota bacterium]
MASVVFLRAVNVGGHGVFKPSLLARDLADLDVASLGAAGTFVVRKRASQAAVRKAFLSKLPVETEMMICSDREVLELFASGFKDAAAGKDVRRFVTVLAREPAEDPRLPIVAPAAGAWQVKVVALAGRFALSLLRRTEGKLFYPNAVVEKALGIPATTRGWDTIAAVCELLK